MLGFSTRVPNPILKSEVIFDISTIRLVPRFLTFSKSSFMEDERSIR
uniref:Uncharacterized protein n=1 Tax=Anguilla anguilla TaxID=7936 RepID=A0A0E9W220_ANGAN